MRRMAKMRSENGWVVMMITMIIPRPAGVSHWKALFWLVLVPLFSCCAFFLRLNQGPPSLRSTTSPSTSTGTSPRYQ